MAALMLIALAVPMFRGEVYVKDDGFRDKNLLPELIDERAKLLPNGGPILNGLDESFAGVMLVGFHAMEGAKDGVLAHSWSSARRRPVFRRS